MKVLIISQPVLDKENNMGKTLMSYFSNFNSKDVAQLYLRKGIPTNSEVCENYYCFSDTDAVKSIINHNIRGRKYNKESIVIKKYRTSDEESPNSAYKIGAAHKAWMLLIRDIIWQLSNWKNDELIKWVKDFNPDIIFCAPGDGAFSYKIADEIAKQFNKPLVMVCVDDFFINNRNKNELLGKIYHKYFIKVIERTMKSCKAIFTICDAMNKAYSKMFGIKCYTLHTAAENKEVMLNKKAKQISYIGNLSCGRYQTLMELGSALKELEIGDFPYYIDVYSATQDKKCIELLKSAPGIKFHGAVSADKVPEIMKNSMAVIHTESFEKRMMELVKFSVSTKIAESLMYGPCILAYGPEGIASIDYLKENGAAFIISSSEHVKEDLELFLKDSLMREKIIERARTLARENHSIMKNPQKVYQWLQIIVEKEEKEELTE